MTLSALSAGALLTDPVLAHGGGHEVVTAGTPLAVVRGLILVPTAVAVGMALLRPVTGPPSRPGHLLCAAAAVIAASANLVAISVNDTWWPLAVTLAVTTLALPLLLGRQVAAVALGVLVAVALAAEATGDHGGTLLLAGVLHTLAATVWLGAAATVATAAAGQRTALLRRLMPYAAGAAVAIAGTGVVQAWQDGLRPDATVTWTSFGLIVLLKVGLLTGVVVLAALAIFRRRATASLIRIEAAGLALAAGAGAGLAVVPEPPAPPVPGTPLLRQVAIGDERVPVLVVPGRPGWNLVHIGSDDAKAGLDEKRLRPATARAGATGSWVAVELPAGRSRLWIGHDGAAGSVAVDTGTATAEVPGLHGPDGPECASAVLGALLSRAPRPLTSCPADTLEAADAEALQAMIRFVAARGVHGVGIHTDTSPRGTRAAAVVRAAAASEGLAVHPPGKREPLFVLSGWASAEGMIRDVAAGRIAAEGTYLAPWLLSGPLLTPPAGQVLPLRFDTHGAASLRYLNTVYAQFPGEPPTAVGYKGWLGTDPTQPLRLYAAASRVFIPGAPAGHHSSAAWVPDGTVTAVTGPLKS